MQTEHFIAGKDASLEFSINTMQEKLLARGFHIEERSWLNPIEGEIGRASCRERV